MDEWQAAVLADGLAERADGLWAAASVDEIASRQNGKNVCVEVRELYGLLVLGEWIIHTAHLFKTTRESYDRLDALVDANSDIRQLRTYRVASPASGYQMRFATGGRVHFIARSRTSGKGLTADVLVLDEAQDLDDDALGALLPTISAGPKNNPQTWYLGSAPGPLSVVWHRRRLAGRSGGSPRSAYLEFSAAPDSDLDDRDAWAQANPGLGRRLLTETVAEERRSMSDEMFARERLSISPDLAGAQVVIPYADWQRCADPSSSFSGPPAFALDVTPDRSRASIAASGLRADGRTHVEVIDNRPGTGWVPARLKELEKRWKPQRMVCDPAGPAGALLTEVEGFEGTSTREHAQACGLIYDLVVQDRLRHRGDPVLDTALFGASKRDLGDGMWLWNRKSSATDISPLVAVTLAVWAASGLAEPVPAGFKDLSDYLDE